MAIEDLYGIQKGEAQVFNNQPYLDLLAEERATNRKAYAEQVAKKAAKAAAINSLDEKLAVEGYDKHTKFLQDKLYGLKDWAKEQYAKHGETVFAENPALAGEWKSKIDDFVRYNTWSKNLINSAKEQHTRALGDNFELDIESLKEHNDYWSLSPEEQYTRPMPLIKDRELTTAEAVEKLHGNAIKTFSKESGYSTMPNADGRYLDVDKVVVLKEKQDALVSDIMANAESPVRETAMRNAAKDILGEGRIGKYTFDQNGQKVENPKFMEEMVKRATDEVRTNVELLSPKESEKSKARYTPGSGSGKDEEESIVQIVDPSQGGPGVRENPTFLKEYEHVANQVYTDGNGNPYVKLSQDFYRLNVDGEDKYYIKSELTEKQLKEANKIPKNTVVDRSFNKIEGKDLDKLTRVTQVTRHKTGDTYAVKIDKEYSNLTNMEYIIGADGKKIEVDLTQGGTGVSVNELIVGAKYKEIDGHIYFEDDDKYKKAKDVKSKTRDFASVKPKGSKNYLLTPVNDDMIIKNPKFAEEYKAIKSEKSGGGKPKAY